MSFHVHVEKYINKYIIKRATTDDEIDMTADEQGRQKNINIFTKKKRS